ncbi:MAG: hypothetical protein Q9181_006272, partial [Wetmoreana brouardii]
WQRIPVAISCVIFLGLASFDLENTLHVLFITLVILACLEKIAATANTVSVERDWVVIICGDDDVRRRDLNASMRRIDLISKLMAPLFISLIDVLSRKVALWVILGSSLVSVMIEYLAIAQVYHAVPDLARMAETEEPSNREVLEPMEVREEPTLKSVSNIRRVSIWFQSALSPWSYYIRSSVLLASLSLCILYLTVLSFNVQMITYLLDSGFTALWVAVLRLVSVVAELGATWAAPVLMSRIGPVRSGLWFITWQLATAAVGVAIFIRKAFDQRVRAMALIVGVLLSRVGLWGFDLSVQYLVQEEIPPSHRSQYSATEAALQNLFEMLSFAATSVFTQPEQFTYPAITRTPTPTAISRPIKFRSEAPATASLEGEFPAAGVGDDVLGTVAVVIDEVGAVFVLATVVEVAVAPIASAAVAAVVPLLGGSPSSGDFGGSPSSGDFGGSPT